VSTNHSVTTWIGLLRQGDGDAAQQLWERYFARLVEFAHGKLRGTSRRASDEEDVALSAFHSFFRAANRFPRLNDRNDLWQILVMLTARKAFQERRRQQSSKRGGRVDGEARQCALATELPELDDIIGPEPSPEFTVMVGERLQTLLDVLPDEELREVARLRLEEHTNTEIAAKLQCSQRTVERKLLLIRGFWEKSSFV
jgi:RNA polymerase sigma factor (sigma-70 family)